MRTYTMDEVLEAYQCSRLRAGVSSALLRLALEALPAPAQPTEVKVGDVWGCRQVVGATWFHEEVVAAVDGNLASFEDGHTASVSWMLDPASGWRRISEGPTPEPAPDLPEVRSWWWSESLGLRQVTDVERGPDLPGLRILWRFPSGWTTATDWPNNSEPVQVCCPDGHWYWLQGYWNRADEKERFSDSVAGGYYGYQRYLPCGRVLLPGGKAVEVVGLEAALATLPRDHWAYGRSLADISNELRALVGKPLGGGDGE